MLRKANHEKTVINIDDVPLMDRGNGKQFAVKWGRVGPLIGLNGLGCAVHVVPPGKKAFPFHRHHVMDELFFVVSGEGEYRFGDTAVPVRSGDIVAAPAGTQAHQLINSGPKSRQLLRGQLLSNIGAGITVEILVLGPSCVSATSQLKRE